MDKFITSDKVFYHLDRLSDWENGNIVNPITFEIHPSNLCNSKCYYCVAEKILDGHMMSREKL